MLTISISESLGPAAWNEWTDTSANEAEVAAWAEATGFSEDAWQQQLHEQWGYEVPLLEGDTALRDMETWRQADDPSDPSSWSLFSGGHVWPTPGLGESGLEGMADPQATSLALNEAAMTNASHTSSALTTAQVNKQAAWASPLRVPLPEPLTAEPLSQFEFELEGLGMEPTDNSSAEEPQKISAVPGPSPLLALPPGLLGMPDSTIVAPVAPGPVQRSGHLAVAAVKSHAPQGMSICSAEVDGLPCTRVEWKIDDFSGKLQASMGRPVVSPAFDACGLSNLRLMVFPDARDAVKSARSHERKSLYANMVKKGPLYGSLKLKADGLEFPTVMTFSMLVGGVRAGPNVYDFSEQAVCGLADFGVDWLQQVEKNSGALRVSIEIFDVRPKK